MIDSMLSAGVVPDFLIRKGIKGLLKKRLVDEYEKVFDKTDLKRKSLVKDLKKSPVAIETDKANDQHYMVPPEFFEKCLGARLKYSCCHWDKATNLDEAEEEMLALTVERAQIKNGDRILELGHGWGAITLYMAENFPDSQIMAVSNSKFQGDFILKKARERGLNNIEITTADMALFDTEEKYDRVISIEMFEHMRNYQTLLGNISRWLSDEGTLFVHVFVHKELAYKFDVVDETDWMSKYFFSGGIMPSEHLFYYFNKDLKVKEHWRVNGVHYAKTAKAWLVNMDANEPFIMNLFEKHYPAGEAKKWFNYWRIFFMSCEELWDYKKGREWFVSHYLFEKQVNG
jgi:cyclopropane-fatty-acyl-phospholipid synthase